MAEKRIRYMYQLSLADGSVLINEGDGFFSVKDAEKPEDKVLINSAVLIKIIEEEQPVEDEAVAVESMPSAEQVVEQVEEVSVELAE